MKLKTEKERLFEDMLNEHKSVIAKVCYVYASPEADFDDLYQETVTNLWLGFEKFRGEAKISTWIYRCAINTCITWIRHNKKYANNVSIDNNLYILADDLAKQSDYCNLLTMIQQLQPLEKAIITLWLDEKCYDEIANITGLSKSNVAVKLHRIKEKLSKMADK